LGQACRGAEACGGPLDFQAWNVYYMIMKEATPKKHGGRRPGSGRPATGKDPVRTIRLSDEFLDKIDHWATQREDQPSRSEAIRRLVELGLKARK
jgi:hypothetical protein